MGYYSQKKLPGCCITYFHDIQNCFKCKSAMESNLQIGRPWKKILRKIRLSSDVIEPESPKILRKEKFIYKQKLRVPKQHDEIKPIKKVLSKKKMKNMPLKPVKNMPLKPVKNMPLKPVRNMTLKPVRNMTLKSIKALLDIPPKKRTFKKKNPTKDNAVKIENFHDRKLKNSKRAQKLSKSTKEKSVVLENVKSSSVKKSSRKSADIKNSTKVPGKGTLKRKRWICLQYSQANENYEDDMYENKKFEHFQSLVLRDDSDSSENFDGMVTPDFPFSLSPRETTPSPTYKDCYDLAQLKKIRAKAEERIYGRNKKKKNCSSENITETPQVEQHSVSTDDVTNQLEQIVKILNESYINNEKPAETANSEKASDVEDQYFCDLQEQDS